MNNSLEARKLYKLIYTLELTKEELASLEFICDLYTELVWDDDLKQEIEQGTTETLKRVVDALRIYDRIQNIKEGSKDA
jgi:hypothetical protein